MTSELENDAYTVGWICDHENRVTAQAMLDEEHGRPQTGDPSDNNSYLLGKIGQHNLVIACLPVGVRGISPAAIVASKMLSSFQKIRIGLLVGTGGGIPSDDFDIRLGDVAVSIPDRTFSGVVQFDMGKATPSGFVRTGSLNKPPTALLTAIGHLDATHTLRGSRIPEYLAQMLHKYPRLAQTYVYQGLENDRLFKADYLHQDDRDRSCKKCRRKGISRLVRDTDPVIHYGTIASSNKVIEDSSIRDRLHDEFGAICAETEAAGLMDNFPCVVIRGICNYADSHWKGAERWRQYASATAAAFAKELLYTLQAREVVQGPLAVDILSG
jgi:nucleoside phosphorylase